MNKISKLDFEGQQIYVGMDVHNKSWSISILIDKFEHKILTQPPEVGTFFELSQLQFSWRGIQVGHLRQEMRLISTLDRTTIDNILRSLSDLVDSQPNAEQMVSILLRLDHSEYVSYYCSQQTRR